MSINRRKMQICLCAASFILQTEYQRLVSEQEMDIYRKSLLMLPLPRYIVLCNASEMKEEKINSPAFGCLPYQGRGEP